MQEERHKLFNHKQMDEFICDASRAIVFKGFSLHASMKYVQKELNRNDWIMYVRALPRLILQQVNEFGQRQRGSFFSARGSRLLRTHLLCRQRDGKLGHVLLRKRMSLWIAQNR